jgi:MoaD family protein
MRLKIKFLKPFSDAIGKDEIELNFDGTILEDLLKILIKRYPGLKREFYYKAGELTDYMCMFVNDKPISALNGLNTELKDSDELLFFVPISGG